MDAKSKANFINSVATGTTIPCPKCGVANKSDSKFCISCGAEIIAPQNSQTNTPAFEQVKGSETSAQAFKYIEPNTVFAEGLPKWSIEPPQIMIRRH